MLNQIRSHLRFSVISMEHIYFASHQFNFNKHVFLLYSHVCKTKELLCHTLFTYLKPLSRCDTYIPRRCHTKILKNGCLNTFNQKWNHLWIERTNGFGKVWIVRCKRKNSAMHCNGTNSKSSSFPFPKLFCFPNYPCYGNITMWYFWTPKVTCSSNKIPQY